MMMSSSNSSRQQHGGGNGGGGGNYSCYGDHFTTTTSSTTITTVLATLLKAHDWTGALSRLATHQHEARMVCVNDENRTALHVACHEDAPAVVIAALVQAYPQASCMVGTSSMTPLHITCSSQHASVQVVRVLYELSISNSNSGKLQNQFHMRDVDGDTALHAACRCGAPIDVLKLLLQANPTAVHERDYEGLTPLLRLWVRYFVILGKDVIENYCSHHCASYDNNVVQSTSTAVVADLKMQEQNENNNTTTTTTATAQRGGGGREGEQLLLAEAWSKTKLLLLCAHHGSLFNEQLQQQQDNNNLSTILHAAVAVDCPRQVVRIAAAAAASVSTVHHHHHHHDSCSCSTSSLLCQRDRNGLTPLHIACLAPIFKVRDLSDEGYTLEDQIHDYDNNNNNNSNEITTSSADDTAIIMNGDPPMQEQHQQQHASVIEILLQAAAAATTKRRQQEKEASSSSTASAAASSAVCSMCMMTDPLGRLPLHLALSTGKRWHYDGVKQLLEANANAISCMDPTCHLYPFMMAAAAATSSSNDSNDCCGDDDDDLNTVFELLRCNPTVLSDIITGKKKKAVNKIINNDNLQHA